MAESDSVIGKKQIIYVKGQAEELSSNDEEDEEPNAFVRAEGVLAVPAEMERTHGDTVRVLQVEIDVDRHGRLVGVVLDDQEDIH